MVSNLVLYSELQHSVLLKISKDPGLVISASVFSDLEFPGVPQSFPGNTEVMRYDGLPLLDN